MDLWHRQKTHHPTPDGFRVTNNPRILLGSWPQGRLVRIAEVVKTDMKVENGKSCRTWRDRAILPIVHIFATKPPTWKFAWPGRLDPLPPGKGPTDQCSNAGLPLRVAGRTYARGPDLYARRRGRPHRGLVPCGEKRARTLPAVFALVLEKVSHDSEQARASR